MTSEFSESIKNIQRGEEISFMLEHGKGDTAI